MHAMLLVTVLSLVYGSARADQNQAENDRISLTGGPFLVDPVCLGDAKNLKRDQVDDCLDRIPAGVSGDNAGQAYVQRLSRQRESAAILCGIADTSEQRLAAYDQPVQADWLLQDSIRKHVQDLRADATEQRAACTSLREENERDTAYWAELQGLRERLLRRSRELDDEPSAKEMEAATRACTHHTEEVFAAERTGRVLDAGFLAQGQLACLSPGEWSRRYGPDRPPSNLYRY